MPLPERRRAAVVAFVTAYVRDRVGAAVRAAAREVPGSAGPREREAAAAALWETLRDAFPAARESLVRDVGQAAGKGSVAVLQWAWQQEVAVPRSPATRGKRLALLAEEIERR